MVIDGNNQAYRAVYKFGDMKNNKGVSTSLIYGVPYILKNTIAKFTPDEVYITFDGGRSHIRKTLLPNYKNRDKKLGFDYENFKEQMDILRAFLPSLGLSVVYKHDMEADDLIYKLCKKKGKITIVSSDKDFNQLISKDVQVYNPYTQATLTHGSLHKRVGYRPEQTVDYLVLDGDSSDKIPGYKGMGEKRIKAFLDEFGSIKNFLNTETAVYKFLDKEVLRDLYKLNRTLIDLRYITIKYKELRDIKISEFTTRGKYDHKTVIDFSRKYNINTFLLPDFTKTFKGL